MSDADEFHPSAKRNDGLPVLKPDHVRGPEARHAKAHEFVEENAAVRVDSAFWYELGLRQGVYLCGIIIPQIHALGATTRNKGLAP